MAEKTIKHQLLSDREIQPCLNDGFLWHRHENYNMGKSGISAWPSFCRPCCARVEPGVVKKRKEWDFCCRGRGTQALLLGPGYVDCTGWLRVGTRIFWLLVLRTNSLNSLAEALNLYLHLGSPLSDSPLQQPQASFPMHHGGVPYNSLRPLSLCTMEVCPTTASGLFPYAPWRFALHPQASLCIVEVCLTTSSGLPMHQEGVP